MDTRLAMALAAAAWLAYQSTCQNRNRGRSRSRRRRESVRRLFGPTAEVSKLDSNAGEGKGREEKEEEKRSKFGGNAP